jgi:hypothetical protein
MTFRVEEYTSVDISIVIRVILITEIILTSKRTVHNITVQYRTVGISTIDVVHYRNFIDYIVSVFRWVLLTPYHVVLMTEKRFDLKTYCTVHNCTDVPYGRYPYCSSVRK